MNNKSAFLKILEQYGSDITYKSMNTNGEYTQSNTSKAFIQPLRYKNKMYIGSNQIPIGEIDGGHYLYIGSPDLRFDKQSDTVIIGYDGEDYYIKRAEPYIFRNEPIYVWAVIAKHNPCEAPL